jgi:hypothetical protein
MPTDFAKYTERMFQYRAALKEHVESGGVERRLVVDSLIDPNLDIFTRKKLEYENTLVLIDLCGECAERVTDKTNAPTIS